MPERNPHQPRAGSFRGLVRMQMSYLSQILRRGDALERKRVVEQVGGLCHRANAFGVAEVLLITTRQTKR